MRSVLFRIGWAIGFVMAWLRRLAWPVKLLGSKVTCALLDRHRNGSPAWERLCDTKVPAFRDRPVFFCRFCGVVAFLDNEPRRLVQLAIRHFSARRSEVLRRRLRVAALAVVMLALAVALTTGGAP